MTSPTTPPPGSSEPPVPPGDDAPRDYKPWIPAIALGVVLVLMVVFLFLRSDGSDDTPESTTTTSSTSTTTSTSTSTTSTTPTTAAPTTAPPTTAPPTTAPPTTAPATTTSTTAPTDPESAALISQCNSSDEFACYEVGRLGLTPPASVKNPASWKNKSDDEVASACQQDLNLTACYVAGVRGIPLGD